MASDHSSQEDLAAKTVHIDMLLALPSDGGPVRTTWLDRHSANAAVARGPAEPQTAQDVRRGHVRLWDMAQSISALEKSLEFYCIEIQYP
jgi:hypothetical protein